MPAAASSKIIHRDDSQAPPQNATAGDPASEFRNLDVATALDLDQLVLHYQPILALAEHRFRGVEALVRWDHPSRGLLPPATFIPRAERDGSIIDVGNWVLAAACRKATQLPGLTTVAVNASPRQLVDGALVRSVVAALEKSGLVADRLEIEITEAVRLNLTTEAAENLYSVREMGVRIIADDFGTGYSSVETLAQFPFDGIKIDRCFVHKLEECPRSRILFRSLVSMARDLGMTITAEGIETLGQWQVAVEMGCDFGQGFFFGRPVRDADIARDIAAAAHCRTKVSL